MEEATQDLVNWAAGFIDAEGDFFTRAKTLVTRLGAHYRSDGLTEVAFWIPDVSPERVRGWSGSAVDHHSQIQQAKSVYLEVLTPLDPIDFRASEQVVHFRRDRLPLRNIGACFCGVVSGMRPGTRSQAGSFYWLRYIDRQNELHTIGDIVAYSVPYGVFAPAELYDINRVQRQRPDLAYFGQGRRSNKGVSGQGVMKVPPPSTILQIHVSTASAEGSLEGLTRIYRRIADKIQAQRPLTLVEKNYIGYSAVQLLPIEPVAEYPAPGSARPGFFLWDETADPLSASLVMTLRKPDIEDWGYDTVIASSSAPNPALLGSLRPDELIDFIATLHQFPTGPIQVIFDITYGHSDNQGEVLLSQQFLRGANMYGQDLNYCDPAVRAILLEMQRRKINMGANGIRVDGAQDFKVFNPETGKVEHDDDYLKEMSQVLQDIEGYQRQLIAIFEDGRPWPEAGWETRATHLDVIAQQPDAYQWGPLVFANNTPMLSNFWNQRWNDVCDIMNHGARWITGCANHDTMRRGIQVDPEANIDWTLGQTLSEVIASAYDNPVVTLLFQGFSPGIPMDFLSATMRSPWCFFRNIDDEYGLKVVAEETGFLDWRLTPRLYSEDWAFVRLKKFGVKDFEQFHTFMKWLHKAVQASEAFSLDALAAQCQQFLKTKLDQPPKVTVPFLKAFAKKYMEDCQDLCNVSHYISGLDPQQVHFNLATRRYRQAHPWLSQNLTEQDYFDRIPMGETTLFYGCRVDPTGSTAQRIAIALHIGGPATTLNLEEHLPSDLAHWQVAIASPGLEVSPELETLRNLKLKAGQGLLLETRVL